MSSNLKQMQSKWKASKFEYKDELSGVSDPTPAPSLKIDLQ